MYELVTKILKESKKNGVDIGVAYDYIAKEIGYTQDLKDAFKLLSKHYETITALNVKKKYADIKVICDMEENGNTNGAKDYIKHLQDEKVI